MVSIYFTGVMVVVRSAKDGLIEFFLYNMSEYGDKDERKTDSNYFFNTSVYFEICCDY